jgi:Na+-transporting methylmalonyl-CoA/oxaloacetate decarboxylase gamma subunit
LDTNVISQGLAISGLGLIITFSSLGIFILIMVVLKKVFPFKEEEESGGADEGDQLPVSAAAVTESGRDDDLAVAAVIGVAIAHALSRSQSKLGNNLEAGRGSWWMANRMAAGQAANLLKK